MARDDVWSRSWQEQPVRSRRPSQQGLARKHRSTLARVHAAMLWIEDARELYDALPTSHTGVLGEVEGIAHELAHQLEAGRNFEWRLDTKNMDGLTANEHEAAALRIEVCGLRVLGVRVSLRRLWADAAWRGEPPVLSPRALTPREQKCVDAFVRIVREAQVATTAPPAPQEIQ